MEPRGIWCCEYLTTCAWQCFALDRGIAHGTPESTTSQWREHHERHCGGRLVQLLTADEMRRLLPEDGDPQEG